MMSLLPRGIAPVPAKHPLEHGYWNAAVPTLCVVPLQQHVGSRLRPLVRPRQVVREGMLIAEGAGRLSASLHAPIPGRVSTVGTTTLADGSRCAAVAIELDGEFDRLGKQPEPREWRASAPEDLLKIVREAGIVAGPRAAVPAHLLLDRGPPTSARVLVLDVAETEPYLSAEAEIAAAAPHELVEALAICSKIVGAEAVHVIVAAGYSNAVSAMRRAVAGHRITMHRVPHRYPANTESQLRRTVGAKREADPDAIVSISPSTAHAIREAVLFQKPHIDRVVAVGGGAVARPAHIRVRIGTSIAEAIQECGGLTRAPERIVAGGVLTGREVRSVNAPITKATAAIVALTAEEIHNGEEEPCIGCGACVRACPVSVHPMLLNNLIVDARENELVENGLFDCVECGLCAHVCPSRIPIVDRLRAAKDRLRGPSS